MSWIKAYNYVPSRLESYIAGRVIDAISIRTVFSKLDHTYSYQEYYQLMTDV